MGNIKFIIIIAITSVFTACSKNPNKKLPVLDLKGVIVDTLFLEKDTLTKSLGSNFKYIRADGEEFLITSVQRRFLKYSYPEGKLVRSQFYVEEGPDGVGSFNQVNFTDDSSVWFVSYQELIQADQFGKVLFRYDLPSGPAERLAINYNTMMGTKAMNVSGKILIPDVPFVLKEPLLEYEDWLLEFDTKDSSISYVKFKYPDKYSEYLDDPNFSSYFNEYNEEENLHVISFPADDSLLVISPNSQKWVYAGVTEKMNFLPGKTEQRGEFTAFLPNSNSSLYNWVAYDPHAQVYLREALVTTGSKENREQGIKELTKLVVLDKDFEKIGEITIPFPARGFSTPEGFYLNIGYPHSEDELAFALLDFSKMKE